MLPSSGAFRPIARSTYALDDVRVACQLRQPARRGLRLGPPAAADVARRGSRANGRAGTNPLAFSGVWRFRELLPFAPPEMVVTIGEGQTLLQNATVVAKYVGLKPRRAATCNTRA